MPGTRAVRASALCVPVLAALIVSGATRDAQAFAVQGLAQFGPDHIAVAFDDSVDTYGALDATHYTVTPQGGSPSVVRTVWLQENQRTAVLVLQNPLSATTTYDVTVSGVTSRGGTPLSPGGPTSFTSVAGTIVSIADVQRDLSSYLGKTITVIGQVFITASSSGGTPSAYIQDGTSRGINVFGNPLQNPLDGLDRVVLVTGLCELYFTTVEITNHTVTELASGMPRLAPQLLTAEQLNNDRWEGTYVQTSGTLSAAPIPSGSNNFSYPMGDLGWPFEFRVRNSTGINPSSFTVGDVITGAGNGSKYQSTYQISVGNGFDFQRGRVGVDLTPPALMRASGNRADSTVTLEFDEPLGPSAENAAAYAVFVTANPTASIAVASAGVSPTHVTLKLAGEMSVASSYTARVNGVADPAGNTVPANTEADFQTSGQAAFEVTGAFQFGSKYIGVGFTKNVNASQATNLANYAFTPDPGISLARLQENGRTVIFEASSPLPSSMPYSLTIAGVTSVFGEPLVSGGPFNFTTVAEQVVDIATIQDDVSSWVGQTVTIIGQTYIPMSSRGGTPSGYIQDGSARGVNVFGGSVQGPVNVLGNVASVTGMVEQYFTTTEITNFTSTLLASGQPHLGARVLTTQQAGSSEWEGTYIQTTGELFAITASGASNYSYDVIDGTNIITFRVGNALGFDPTSFVLGERLTARGAGGAYQSSFQVNVGNVEDFFRASGIDTLPPGVAGATGTAGASVIDVQFTEAVRPTEATVTSNYLVYPTNNPGTLIPVTSAVVASDSRSVLLHIAATLEDGTTYRVEVSNLVDLAGNPMAPGALATFTARSPAATAARITAPPVTLVKNMAAQGEVYSFVIEGVLDTKLLCRVYDLQGRLVKVIFDGRLTGTPKKTVTWDGRDESFELVPAGMYIAHLLSTDLSGNVTEDRAPIVVALRLE